uniref:L1 transposable element RRM domain-containing protein n=1 Tax=Heliothis virescens TaxID=7102 RepID=A0A2A4JC18_HELVI
MTQMMAMLNTINTNQKEFIEKTSEDLSAIKTQVSDIKSTINNLTSEQQAMRLDITSIQNKNTYLETKIESLQSMLDSTNLSSATPYQNSNVCETIISEINERENRSKNIILIGIPEPTALNKEDRLEKDKSEVIKVLKKIDAECPEPEKYIRLGKYNPMKIRPIKISFKSKETAITLLRKKNTLQYDNLKIYSDQTPQQQKYLKDLQERLKQEHEEGNKTLIIKYVKGVPKITDPNSKNYDH